ncbi:MAG: MarR family transcriptional regulator [Candidatus Bathyarchaeota archaeon]|nr:MarR family transcriptional regulator [Candidatus Termiticorpusculum sp.]
MDQTKEQLMQLAVNLRRRGIIAMTEMNDTIQTLVGVSLYEFLLLRSVAKTDSESNFSLLDIQSSQFISKSGVSKMLSTLEKKGYLVRETDKNNRRKIIVTLTTTGYKAIEHFDKIIDDYLTEYINVAGEDSLKQLFAIIDQLYQVSKNITEKMRDKYFKTNQVKEE